jgi:cytochrome c oxidase subunit 2
MLLSLISIQDPLNQLPPPASNFAGEVDGLFYFLFWVSVFFFALILGLLVYSAVKHRRRTPDQPAASNVTHNTPLEVVWTLIPTIILMVIFAWGFKGNKDQLVAPADALQFRAEAWKWAWAFYHPDSQTAAEELYVPLGEPVKITLTSRDVLHSFYIPAFRIKRDVVPGVKQMVWFTPTELGDFDIFCAEYCGDGHSLMRRKVHVVPPEVFHATPPPWPEVPDDPVAAGEYYYRINCIACHSLDGSKVVGPTFQGVWMREGKLESGESYVADESYIRNSIRNPMAQIVQGYAPAMPVFTEAQLSDEAVGNIIEWMKTLK